MPSSAEKRRQIRAETIMGEAEYAHQVRRKRKAKMRGSKASTIETIKRVSAYKKRNPRRKKPIHNGKRI